MTEVAMNVIPSVRRYEAAPPAGMELVQTGDTVATTKEEEWISKKKTEVTNTKQIETRVKRQVVLEDGKIVEDSGPMVTTNTKEDTDTQEHHQTELRKLGDNETTEVYAGVGSIQDSSVIDPESISKSKWVSVPNTEGVVREVKERKVVSREETEEVKETEDVQHLGDITDEDFLSAVRSGDPDLRRVLRSQEKGREIVSTGPRLVLDTKKSKKTIDTEDVRELSSIRDDGKIVTETQRTTEHEVIKDEELPDDAPPQNFQKESSQRYLKTREQEDVDYIADGVNIGHEMRFKTETMEADRRGDGGRDEPDLFESLSARARKRGNTQKQQPYRQRGIEEQGASPLDRKDALTRRPLDFDQEEETRKVETSKWLEHHFGSDSRSSNNSTIDDEEHNPPKTSFFNVTIKSQTIRNDHKERDNRVYSPVEPERDRNNVGGGYYKGISEWSHQERQQSYSPYAGVDRIRRSPSPSPDYRTSRSPIPDYRNQHSPIPDYIRNQSSPLSQEYSRGSPREIVTITPTPPRRIKNERSRQIEQVEEPPPDYSPPSPDSKRQSQKTRFVVETSPKPQKTGNIIGQSIRKLVGKIRSASAERKARARAKRSPSPPSYQQGHVIDGNIGHSMDRLDRIDRPVQRYYLGEDPFGGSIYGRENKYEGAKPARRRTRETQEDNRRSQSKNTLGRFSKSTSRLANGHQQQHQEEKTHSQTLPRHLPKINVSIINTVSDKTPPVKPQRTYKSNLSRSKSLNVHGNMFASNPQLHQPIGLKSPGLISSLNRRSPNDTARFNYHRNGTSDDNDAKQAFFHSLKNRAPELFKTLEEPGYNVYEPPTRLRPNADFTETYHTSTRSDDPYNPSTTNTTKHFSRKSGPGMETVESMTKIIKTSSSGSGNYKGDFGRQIEDRWGSSYGPGSKPVVIEIKNYK